VTKITIFEASNDCESLKRLHTNPIIEYEIFCTPTSALEIREVGAFQA